MYHKRLDCLRAWLEGEKLHAFLVPRCDEFLTKETAPYAKRLAWISGFQGTAGFLVVTADKAALFTDRRYSLGARQDLDATLFDVFDLEEKTPTDWLIAHLPKGGRIAFDPWLESIEKVQRECALFERAGLSFVPVSPNPIDTLWCDQPARPQEKILIHPLSYAGETSEHKRAKVAASLPTKGCVFLAANESLCWLLNLRGQDTACAPLFHGYGLLEASGQAHLFVDLAKVTDAVRQALGPQVSLWERDALPSRLLSIIDDQTLFLDPNETPFAISQIITAKGHTWQSQKDPCLLPKALKNPCELDHIRADHITDGIALVRCFHWLETREISSCSVGEWDIAQKLIQLKKKANNYWAESFDAIIGYGPNSAIIHYRPSPQTQALLKPEGILLVDTGTQYVTGTTTDMTRTFTLGPPTADQKDAYTRVLKGHIHLAKTVFPVKTKGSHLDALARLFLWEAGLDYAHSTGHGVGSFLGVHEGPQGFSRENNVPLTPSMIITIEPGYYKAGHFGIRLENMVEIVETQPGENGSRFFGFKALTLVPFERTLMDLALLSQDEKKWINGYHQQVFETLSPHLEPEVRTWLADKTRPLETH